MNRAPLRKVTKQAPCPICGRPGWCSVSCDGALCICMRVSEGAKKPSANGGFVHVLREDRGWRSRPQVRLIRAGASESCRTEMDRLARQCRQAVGRSALQDLADSLGLTSESLGRLRVGWDARRGAWIFPMVDHAGHVQGIRLRFPDGQKLAVTGGHEGLFIPDGLDYSRPLVIAEGPTDCAAILDMGFPSIGRPSCSGGVRHCIELVRAHWPLDVVVMADSDPPGRRGAESLAIALLPYARSVRVICPPDGIKDARAWKRAGATRADVQAALDAAPVLAIIIKGVKNDH